MNHQVNINWWHGPWGLQALLLIVPVGGTAILILFFSWKLIVGVVSGKIP